MKAIKPIITSGKRKKAVARAVVKQGEGIVRINQRLIEHIEPAMLRMKLLEPLLIAGEKARQVDIEVRLQGGGVVSGAEAARLAIARGLVAAFNDKNLEKQMLEYDRHLLVADVRQKEARKPNRHGKARAKRQKSYR